MIDVMIAMDDDTLSINCCKAITKEKDITLPLCTDNIENVVINYLDVKPDVLILGFKDVEFKRINYAIEAIYALENTYDNKNIILISDEKNNLVSKKVYKTYDFDINTKDLTSDIMSITNSSFYKNDKDIKNFMLNFGINTYSDSANLLMEMCKYCLSIYPTSFKMCDLYKRFGMIHGVPADTIRGSIQSVLTTANNNVDRKWLLSLFPYIDKNQNLNTKLFFQIVIDYFCN